MEQATRPSCEKLLCFSPIQLACFDRKSNNDPSPLERTTSLLLNIAGLGSRFFALPGILCFFASCVNGTFRMTELMAQNPLPNNTTQPPESVDHSNLQDLNRLALAVSLFVMVSIKVIVHFVQADFIPTIFKANSLEEFSKCKRQCDDKGRLFALFEKQCGDEDRVFALIKKQCGDKKCLFLYASSLKLLTTLAVAYTVAGASEAGLHYEIGDTEHGINLTPLPIELKELAITYNDHILPNLMEIKWVLRASLMMILVGSAYTLIDSAIEDVIKLIQAARMLCALKNFTKDEMRTRILLEQ